VVTRSGLNCAGYDRRRAATSAIGHSRLLLTCRQLPLKPGLRCKTRPISSAWLSYEFSWPFLGHFLASAALPLRTRLREAGSSQSWRGTPEKLGQPPQILRCCCEQHLVSGTSQAPQPKSVEPENPFHMRKSHLDLLPLAARLLEGLCIGQCTDMIAHIFVEVAGDFAHDRRRTLRLQ
jgi:hypothetical protein